MPQNLPGNAAPSRSPSHKHPLDLRASPINGPKRATADRIFAILRNHEISACSFEFSCVDSIDRQTRIKRSNVHVQLANQRASSIGGGAYGCNLHVNVRLRRHWHGSPITSDKAFPEMMRCFLT